MTPNQIKECECHCPKGNNHFGCLCMKTHEHCRPSEKRKAYVEKVLNSIEKSLGRPQPPQKAGDKSQNHFIDTNEMVDEPEKVLDDWKQLKAYLLAMDEAMNAWNGLDHCKNCGTNFKELIERIEKILNQNNQ